MWIESGCFERHCSPSIECRLCIKISYWMSLMEINIRRINISGWIGPKLKISLFPLTRPTLSKSADWNFFIENLPSLFFPFCWKFVLLKIPYFRFISPKDRYFRITEHIFVVQKKKSLHTIIHFQNCGSGKGKQKYF